MPIIAFRMITAKYKAMLPYVQIFQKSNAASLLLTGTELIIESEGLDDCASSCSCKNLENSVQGAAFTVIIGYHSYYVQR